MTLRKKNYNAINFGNYNRQLYYADMNGGGNSQSMNLYPVISQTVITPFNVSPDQETRRL